MTRRAQKLVVEWLCVGTLIALITFVGIVVAEQVINRAHATNEPPAAVEATDAPR